MAIRNVVVHISASIKGIGAKMSGNVRKKESPFATSVAALIAVIIICIF